MKSLRFYRLCKTTTPILLCQEIHTNHVLLGRGGRKVSPIQRYEPGTRYRDSFLKEDAISQTPIEEEEDELDEEHIDLMNLDRAYDENLREQKRRREKKGQIITYKRFFAPRPQPPMLTYQERECIKYLHKQDPIQWDVRTLSESFPATMDTISKVLKSKWKISPDKAKKIDAIVQKNWELLAEGKLDADPHVIEHLKKFVNRREVLLEQIKNEKFYLPEVKKEPVWNNGELNSILTKYEKQIKQLAESAKQLQAGSPEEKSMLTKESSEDLVHKKIEKIASTRDPEEKDSFVLGKMLNCYAKERTLDELERQILNKSERREKLGKVEEIILRHKLGVPSSNYGDLPVRTSSTTMGTQEVVKESTGMDSKRTGKINNKMRHSLRMVTNSVKIKFEEEEGFIEDDRRHQAHERGVRKQEKVNQSLGFDGDEIRKTYRESRSHLRMVKMKSEEEDEDLKVDDRTHQADEMSVGKVLNKVNSVPKTKEKVKKEIDFSDPERLARENKFYDGEVEHIKNTSFWNSGRNSQEKCLAESQKPWNDCQAFDPRAVISSENPLSERDCYPDRINIPKSQRGSGLTFRIKDCYYDDDGEFLYRVPGMIK